MKDTPTEQLLQDLTAQVKHLEQVIRDQGTLGLTHGRRFIYIQNTKRSLWNFIADDEPVDAKALTGYITDLYRKEDDIPKLHIVVRTREAEYVLCSGFETHFSRDVMAAIAQLTSQQAHRPLKIIPCLKTVKMRDKPEDKSLKKPVYANVLLDDRTIYTHQLKQQFTADELFTEAKQVLSGRESQSLNSIGLNSPIIAPSSIARSPKAISQKPAQSAQSTDQTSSKIDSVDWKAFCRQHGIFPGVLKALAQDLGLPMGKLNPRQSALLYQQAYARFVSVA